MGRSNDDNYRSKTVGRDEMERTGGKLLKNKRVGLIFVMYGGKNMRMKEETV